MKETLSQIVHWMSTHQADVAALVMCATAVLMVVGVSWWLSRPTPLQREMDKISKAIKDGSMKVGHSKCSLCPNEGQPCDLDCEKVRFDASQVDPGHIKLASEKCGHCPVGAGPCYLNCEKVVPNYERTQRPKTKEFNKKKEEVLNQLKTLSQTVDKLKERLNRKNQTTRTCDCGPRDGCSFCPRSETKTIHKVDITPPGQAQKPKVKSTFTVRRIKVVNGDIVEDYNKTWTA